MRKHLLRRSAIGAALLLLGGVAVNANAADCDVSIVAGTSQNGAWTSGEDNTQIWSRTGDGEALVSASEIVSRLKSGQNVAIRVIGGSCQDTAKGGIAINSGISWETKTTLKLETHLGIDINAPVVVGSGATLQLGLIGMGGQVSTKLTVDGFVGKVQLDGGASLKIAGESYTVI